MGISRPLLMVLAGAAFGPAAAKAACESDVVEFRTEGGAVQRFHVELADDPAEQAQGLMFREKLASSSGMLFAFPSAKHASFWMKNTLIPLDMIFLDEAGKVTRVHPNAVPQDTTVIDGGEGVRFVLEINGGLAAPLGITEGAVMRHPLVPATTAAWACDAP